MSPLFDLDTAWELVRRRAATTPDAAMLVDEYGRALTFGQFAGWAERTAAGLHDLGVRAGSAVTWQLPTWLETVVASAALARLGAVQNPIIPIYREREVGFVLAQTGCEFLLVPRQWRGFDFEAMGQELSAGLATRPRVITVDPLLRPGLDHADVGALPSGDPAALPPAPCNGDEVRWLYYTSGTTSDPKGVQHTDRSLMAAGKGLAVATQATAADVAIAAFPFAHIGGPDLVYALLAVGSSMLIMEHFVPATAVDLMRRHGVTRVDGGPAFYQAYLNEQRKQPERPLVPTLRSMAGGGAPKPPELFFEIQREMGVRVFHGFGCTECGVITMGGPDDTDAQLAYSDGAPIVGVQVRIHRPDGSLAGVGEDGEIRVSGDPVCQGYTDPALTAEAFDGDGFCRTGDIGHFRADGHIVITGRVKDIIIRKGENISAKEIEDLLYAHPKVAAVAVIGLPDRERGERVCAVVETAPGQQSLTFEEMLAHLKAAEIMVQKIPEQLEVVDELPRGNPPMSKVLKYKLRERFAGATP
jgi:acyl-CoA synthetase (AMP-forming)/AMP-acid ligase II